MPLLEKTETLKVRSVADAMRLGAWLRSGEGTGWLAAGTIPNSLSRALFFYLFLVCIFCCSFLFVVFFFFFVVFTYLFFVQQTTYVLDWQPRILLGMVEARSANNVKKATNNAK